MKLELRRITVEEVGALHALLADEDIRAGALIGHSGGGVDLAPFLRDGRNVMLVCEDDERTVHGALLFHWQEPGVYEVHTMALRDARGRPYMHVVNDALRMMFLQSDAMELYTRVPEGNDAALGLVRFVRGRREFEINGTWFYALRWFDWLWGPQAAQALVKRGAWFHKRLEEQYVEQNRMHEAHADNSDHDRVVGATCELILSGLVPKALVLYNRWAKLAGYAQASVVVVQPLVIDIGDALLQVDFASRDFLLLDVKPEDLRATRSAA